MRAVAERHDLVFRKLAHFVADGHSLVLVRGNHDVEFYWDSAREADINEQPAALATSDKVTRSADRRRRWLIAPPMISAADSTSPAGE